jgi:hypothetical protein
VIGWSGLTPLASRETRENLTLRWVKDFHSKVAQTTHMLAILLVFKGFRARKNHYCAA